MEPAIIKPKKWWTIPKINEQEIEQYLEQNGLTAQKIQSGLYYIINELGTSIHPVITNKVIVVYKGYCTNGEVFDQSSDARIAFDLQQIIKRWTEGITYFNPH